MEFVPAEEETARCDHRCRAADVFARRLAKPRAREGRRTGRVRRRRFGARSDFDKIRRVSTTSGFTAQARTRPRESRPAHGHIEAGASLDPADVNYATLAARFFGNRSLD